jgi:hypothetical protein
MMQDSDVLSSLKSSLQYIEEVTESRNDPSLAPENAQAAVKLRKVIGQIENRVNSKSPLNPASITYSRFAAIQELLKQRRAAAASIFDAPETQEHRVRLPYLSILQTYNVVSTTFEQSSTMTASTDGITSIHTLWIPKRVFGGRQLIIP